MQTKTFVMKKEKTLIYFLVLTSISILAPFFGNQLITGSLVNAILFLGTALLGLQAGIFLAFLPSLFALSVGLLPPALLPMIPFIIVGNIILIVVSHISSRINDYMRIFLASLLKFLFLFSFSSVMVKSLNIPSQIAVMMSWPQFLTALMGGIFAFLFLNIYKEKINF